VETGFGIESKAGDGAFAVVTSTRAQCLPLAIASSTRCVTARGSAVEAAPRVVTCLGRDLTKVVMGTGSSWATT